MTPNEADKVLAALSAAWPGMELTAPTVMAWYDVLADVPYNAAEAAVRRVVREDKWFPAIARFREVAFAARRALESKAANERGLPEPEYTEADHARNLAAIRRLKAHHHGGGR